MFRTVPLSIIRSSSLYTQQWYMSYWFADSLLAGSGVLILLASCQQTFMTYIVAVCTVKNSWWWIEEPSETCRILFQKQIWEISATSWFYYKNMSRCTVTWTSNTYIHTYINTYIHTHTYIRTYIHIHTYTHTHTYIHTYINTYIHTCVCMHFHDDFPIHLYSAWVCTAQCMLQAVLFACFYRCFCFTSSLQIVDNQAEFLWFLWI